jgi:hypothetical protein
VDGAAFEGNTNITIEDGGFIMEDFDVDNTLDQVTNPGEADVEVMEDGHLSAEVDVDKLSVGSLPGSSAEFAAGYEGAGASSGVMTIIRVDSIGTESTGAKAHIKVQYMLIPR